VQVTKDPVGPQGRPADQPGLACPARYLVYVPGRVDDRHQPQSCPTPKRNRLKAILKKVMPENAGVIVRTAAEGAAEEELAGDVTRLAAQWETIEKESPRRPAPRRCSTASPT